MVIYGKVEALSRLLVSEGGGLKKEKRHACAMQLNEEGKGRWATAADVVHAGRLARALAFWWPLSFVTFRRSYTSS